MGFQINCDRKGCGQVVEAELDMTDNKVYCPACQGEITNITSFAKTSLKSMKQTRKVKKEGGSILCPVCKLEAIPKIQGQQFVCQKCQTVFQNIPTAFQTVIKGILAEKVKEELEIQVEENKKAKKLSGFIPKALPKGEIKKKE